MTRKKQLNKLEKKLEILKKKSEILNNSRIREDGSIDMDSCDKLNHILTDISLTKRKISFSKNGKSYLGNCIGDQTPRITSSD